MAQVLLKTLYHWRCDLCRKTGGTVGGEGSSEADARQKLVTHFYDNHPAFGRDPMTIHGTSFGRYIFVLVDGMRLQRELHG